MTSLQLVHSAYSCMKQEKNKSEKLKPLLKLARDAIESKFEDMEIYVDEDIKKKFSKKQSCFITLTEDNMLRGCIGSLYANQELWKDVVDNSINSAFHDPRFLPVSIEELDKLYRLAALRIWSLKEIIYNYQQNKDERRTNNDNGERISG